MFLWKRKSFSEFLYYDLGNSVLLVGIFLLWYIYIKGDSVKNHTNRIVLPSKFADGIILRWLKGYGDLYDYKGYYF